MGKSILVIDTPESCQQCLFSGADGDRCCLTDKMISEEEYLNSKPNWCPLQDAPEKKDKNPYHNERESGYVDGWNDCVDKILGSDDCKETRKQTNKDCANCVCSSCSHKTECCEDCEGAIRDCEERNAPYS